MIRCATILLCKPETWKPKAKRGTTSPRSRSVWPWQRLWARRQETRRSTPTIYWHLLHSHGMISPQFGWSRSQSTSPSWGRATAHFLPATFTVSDDNTFQCVRTADWIGLCSVLRPLQHSIGYMGDGFNGFYRSNDPTNSIKVLKEKAAKENNTKNIKKTENTHTHKSIQYTHSIQV